MAEPTSVAVKSALAGAVIAALGPFAGEYAFIFMGGFTGACLSLMMLDKRLPGWWAALKHVLAGMGASLVFASVASAVAAKLLPDSWGLTDDMLWLPVSTMIALYWRQAAVLARRVAFDRLAPASRDKDAGKD